MFGPLARSIQQRRHYRVHKHDIQYIYCVRHLARRPHSTAHDDLLVELGATMLALAYVPTLRAPVRGRNASQACSWSRTLLGFIGRESPRLGLIAKAGAAPGLVTAA